LVNQKKKVRKFITIAVLIGAGAFFYQQYRAAKPQDIKIKKPREKKQKNGN
jgi:hypothetical protein